MDDDGVRTELQPAHCCRVKDRASIAEAGSASVSTCRG